MHPFDQIHSRDAAAFPFAAFDEYARCFKVDSRAAPQEIASGFFRAAGLSQLARLTFDEDHSPRLIHRDVSIRLELPAAASPQHGLLLALQAYFGARHSVRYLDHVAPPGTIYLVVQPGSTWARLDLANPYVEWFFKPLDRLPDIFVV